MSGESDKWNNETMHRLARGISIEQELDHLRQDNERLKGEVEKWRLLSVKEAIAADNAKSDLQRHKSCLEVARGGLREWIKFTSITPVFPLNDWFKMREELLSTTNDALHQINEVLGGDSTKTTEK